MGSVVRRARGGRAGGRAPGRAVVLDGTGARSCRPVPCRADHPWDPCRTSNPWSRNRRRGDAARAPGRVRPGYGGGAGPGDVAGRGGRQPRPDPARERGLRAARPVHRPGRRRAVVRPAGADPHPRVHQAAQPARRRAGHGPGLHPVPAALAARHRRYPARGQPRRAGRGRAAAGLRAGRRGLGEGHLPGPGHRVPPGMAGRGVPGRRRHLGPAVGPRRRGRTAPARRHPVPGHADHPDDPRRPAVAAAGGPR